MSAASEAKIGTHVSYEDMANPRRYGVVCDIRTVRLYENMRHVTTTETITFDIAWEDGEISSTDLRQRGWRIERLTCEICCQPILDGERFHDGREHGDEIAHASCVRDWFRRNYGREGLS